MENPRTGECRFGLTAQEMRVYRGIANGQSAKEIARDIFMSVKTVEKHKSNIYTKLKMNKIYDIVIHAIKNRVLIVDIPEVPPYP